MSTRFFPANAEDSGPGCKGGQPARLQLWRACALVEVDNFVSLRRHLGRPRASSLVQDLCSAIEEMFPDMRAEPASRQIVELWFECERSEAAGEMLDALDAFFAKPALFDHEHYMVVVRIGGAVMPAFDDDDIRLIEAAETALEQAREEKRIVTFDLSRGDQPFHRHTLVRELPRAIAAGELFLQYQPKVHVRRQEIAGAEALIRWEHPTRGLIMPGEFIAAAEEAGSIAALTIWTIKQVISDQRRLARAGYDIPVFVNISGVLLADSDFVAQACTMLRDSEAKIGFEITETSVIRDPATALKHLQEFADIGIPVAIDDYGAGLSSLAYLKQLPASELKIDKMFVTQLTSSNRDPLIVRSTIDLAHAMEMEVTAEGVETPAAMALLGVMGCDLVQGFLISRPLGFDAFLKFVREDAHLAVAVPAIPGLRHGDTFWKRA